MRAGRGPIRRRQWPSPSGLLSTEPPSPKAVSERAAIFTSVVRRYLTSSDNSFSGQKFPIAYVLDTARADSGNPQPNGSPAPAVPIAPADQASVVAGLQDVTTVRFVADRDSVIVTKDGCAQVRDGGILIILAPPVGGPATVHVGIHGFVACLGATWFTYVVERTGDRWTVKGTTGAMAIA